MIIYLVIIYLLIGRGILEYEKNQPCLYPIMLVLLWAPMLLLVGFIATVLSIKDFVSK